MKPFETMSISQTAEILGISKASIRNWIRHGYLKPVNSTGKSFDGKEVLNLKKAIINGELNRLKTRANKTSADKSFIPTEYVPEPENRKTMLRILDFIKEKKIEYRLAILILAIREFMDNEDILSQDIKEILNFQPDVFPRKNVCLELKGLFMSINAEYDVLAAVEKGKEEIEYLLSLHLPEINDVLGLVYQSLINEGDKSRLGSYFTPKLIVHRMVRENIRPDYNVLDPCCGTGQFLLAFADHLPDPQRIWGIDIDPLAVRIARINLLLKYSEDFRPKIYNYNTLDTDSLFIDTLNGDGIKFDLIATNPPWGAETDPCNLDLLRKKYTEISSGESFSYFLRIGLDFLKEEGVLSFLLPESILNVKAHRDIRKLLSENSRLKTIEGLGKIFKKVLSPAVILETIKGKPQENHQLRVRLGQKDYMIPQKRFWTNQDNIFDIHLSPRDEEIISKVYAYPHTTLKNQAEWALGIVTGDNKKYLSPEQSEGFEPIYRGSDVESFVLKKPGCYIKYTPERFQQAAPEELYRASEKLVYRFISQRLIFAYDTSRSLTLNSANILIPKLDNCPLKIILALFNSTLYQYIYQKKFNTLKVLRGNLEILPIPLWKEEVLSQVTELTDRIMKGEELFPNLDTYIMEQFGLTQEEKEYLRKEVR